MDFEVYMKRALELAEEAAAAGEVPVGCVICDSEGRIIGEGRNRREENSDATAHAETEAIRAAGKTLGDWRLSGCTMFVTLEPCPMCTGAIINARIPRLVYGAKDDITGSCGSVINLFFESYGHSPAVFSGILGDESSRILKDYFAGLRK